MIINKKSYFIIRDIFDKYPNTVPFKIFINNKFYIELTKSEFHKCLYKEVICKYMTLPISKIVSWARYKGQQYIFYVDSEEFEEAILKVENEWYDSNYKFMTGKVVKEVWN